MKKEEAIEIAKSELKRRGWKFEPEDIIAFKFKREILYWKYKWEVTGGNSVSRKDNILSYNQISVAIDDISGKVIYCNFKPVKLELVEICFFPKAIPVLTPSEKITQRLLNIINLPFNLLGSIVETIIIFFICPIICFLQKAYCPRCEGELRTLYAKQCPHCFFAWHELNDQKRFK